MFAPRQYESKFLHYYLMHRKRPALIVLMLQGAEIPAGYTLAEKYSVVHRVVKNFLSQQNFFINFYFKYQNRGFLTRAVPNRHVREPYRFYGLLHVFLLPRSVVPKNIKS